MEMLEIDGAHGGGQLLRTALSLSLCTGIGFTMENIRAKRSRPGLMRQHLTAVNAAALVGNACAHGAELGATALRFEPGVVEPGEYVFATGSAGSTTLVLQTLLPALWGCTSPSRLSLEGGTHNPMAPTADFIADSYLPTLRQLGIEAQLELDAHGFYPAGGGAISVAIEPCARVAQGSFNDRGDLLAIEATALLSALSASIGRRELSVLGRRLNLPEERLLLRSVRPAHGPGNALTACVRHSAHVASFTTFGEHRVSAEKVAERLAEQVHAYLDSGACVGEHLADQLLLPMALAGAGEFTSTAPSDHLRSNAALIEKFLAVEISWHPINDHAWRIVVAS